MQISRIFQWRWWIKNRWRLPGFARGERVATGNWRRCCCWDLTLENCVSSSNQGTTLYSRLSLAFSHPRVSLSLLCRCNLASFVTSLLSATKGGRAETWISRAKLDWAASVTPPFVHVATFPPWQTPSFPSVSPSREFYPLLDSWSNDTKIPLPMRVEQRCAFTD